MNCGRVFSQQFLITNMRTEPKQGNLVSNRTDSSVSVDERLIKESRGGSQRSLPLLDLSRKIEGPLLAGYQQLDCAKEIKKTHPRALLSSVSTREFLRTREKCFSHFSSVLKNSQVLI